MGRRRVMWIDLCFKPKYGDSAWRLWDPACRIHPDDQKQGLNLYV